VDRFLPWRAVASAEAAEDDVTNTAVKETKKACHLFHDSIQSNPANSTPKKYQKC